MNRLPSRNSNNLSTAPIHGRSSIQSASQQPWAYSTQTEPRDDEEDAIGESDDAGGPSSAQNSTKQEGQGTGSTAGTAPKRKRPLKLTASQRERKRAIDREAQRSIRIKTKNYIAHLESLVKAMEQNDAGGPDGENHQTRELMNQLRQSQEEVRRLREAMLGVQRVLGGALGDSFKLASSGEAQEQRQLSSSASPPSGSEQPPTLGRSFSASRQPNTDASAPFWLPSADSTQPSTSTAVASSHTSPPGMHPARPAKDPSQRFEGEMFYYAEYHLSRVYNSPGPGAFSNRPFDEDIIVRAVVEGWAAVEERHHLDLGWQVLQEIDQVIFGDCGVVERMAALRLLRMKLLHTANIKAGSSIPPPQDIPQYMTNEVIQHDNRANVVDNFVWPGFRKLLLDTPQRYITNELNESFRHNLKFLWPFDAADTYTKDPVTSLYCSTPEFMRRQADIRCWTMKRVFFNGHEELWETIPAYEADIQKSLPAPPLNVSVGMQGQGTVMVDEHDVDDGDIASSAGPGPAVLPSHGPSSWVGHGAVQSLPHVSHGLPMPGYWAGPMDPGMGQGFAAPGHGMPPPRGPQTHHGYPP